MHNGNPQKLNNFYKCENPLNNTFGRYPICKDCLNEMIDPDNPATLFKVLRDMDVAFVSDVWEKSKVLHPNNVFGNYMRSMNTLVQYKGLHFDPSQTVVTQEEIDKMKDQADNSALGLSRAKNKEEERSNIKMAYDKKKELATFWGAGYNVTELEAMQKKYDKIAESYATPTQMHVENLKRYCKYSVKEDMALASNNATDARNWGDLASKAAQAAKLNVSQMSAADLQGGVNSFSEVVQAVESAVDVIPILNKFVYRPNDALDLILWEYCNYARHLRGLKDESYEDIYKFYKEKKEEYIETTGDPYGFYSDDTTDANHESAEKFVHALDDVDNDLGEEESEGNANDGTETGQEKKQ